MPTEFILSCIQCNCVPVSQQALRAQWKLNDSERMNSGDNDDDDLKKSLVYIL